LEDKVRRLIEDLSELDCDSAYAVIQALHMYYTTGTIPADLTGEAKLTVVSMIERG
jgi:hypothetical protein